MMKSGDFKPPKSGVVNTNVQKEGDNDDKPPENVNDCETFVDFMGATTSTLVSLTTSLTKMTLLDSLASSS